MIIPKHLTPIVYVVNTEPRILLNSFQFFSRNLFYKLNNEQTWRMRWTLLGSRSDRYKQSGTVMKRGCETGNRFPIKVVHYPGPKTLLKMKGETTRVNNKYARRCAGVYFILHLLPVRHLVETVRVSLVEDSTSGCLGFLFLLKLLHGREWIGTSSAEALLLVLGDKFVLGRFDKINET